MTSGARAPRGGALATVASLFWRLIALAVIDAITILFAYGLNAGGLLIAAVLLVIVTVGINVVFLVDRLYPLRWISPGVLLLVLMVLYPVLYTVYIAFTNYSGQHNLSKQQVIEQLAAEYYTPEGAPAYTWRAYRSESGDFKILLQDESNNRFLASESTGIQPIPANDPVFGTVDQDPPPTLDGGYTLLKRLESIRYLTPLTALQITGQINGQTALLHIENLDSAVEGFQRYVYDASTDSITDKESGTVYKADAGFFGTEDDHVGVGFSDFTGLRNFQRVVTDQRLTADFFGVFTWTFIFAFLSVFFCFVLGLALALVFNDDRLPLKGVFRTLAIIPYTIPGFISALVWVGLLNPNFGPINAFLRSISGNALNPLWFSDGTLAKAAIFIVNTWLGYPYMLIVTLGALQSIPTDLYEAAEIDGASSWQRFRTITFPLLMVAIAPLLIGSFAFNFNNFTLIDLVTEGGPPRPGAVSPAGQTDILISYSFRLAFAAGKGNDYAFAAAISIFIFAIVAGITLINFRLSRRAENLTG